MKTKFLLMLGLAAISMASCSDEEEIVNNGDYSKTEISILGTVAPGSQSRAIDTQWEAGDTIGLIQSTYIINKPYVTTKGDGVFTNVEGADYFPDGKMRTYYAYYPYSDALSQGTILYTINGTATEDGQKAHDLLWADQMTSASSSQIRMTFKHKMARVIFNVTTDTLSGFYADDIFGTVTGSNITSSKGTLLGVYQGATFSVTSGNVSTKYGTNADLALTGTDDKENHVRTYMLIVPPQNSCDLLIHFEGTSGSYEFKTKLESVKWAAGYTYTYNVKLQRREAVVSATISEWTTGTESTVSGSAY
jgi:hypothetical protein